MRFLAPNVIICLMFPLIVSAQVVDQRSIDQHIVVQVLKGQEQIFARDYDGALKIFRSLQKDFPTSPAGFFGEMAVDEVKMLEKEDFSLEKEAWATAARGEKAIDNVMQRYEPTALELMFSASLYGLEGFSRARQRHWWSAYVLGSKSRQIFHRIQQADPHFVDADFGLGMYIYWRSVFTKELSFLPFFPDRRAEGIAMVRGVAERGWVAKEMAKVNLGYIDLEEHHYAQAATIFFDYLTRFPQNIVLRLALGRAYLADKKYDASIEQFAEILKSEPGVARAHYFIAVNLIQQGKKERLADARLRLDGFLKTGPNREWQSYTHYWRGVIAERQEKKEEARKEFQAALALNSGLEGAKFHLRGLGGGW